jgi:hypothetical protein
MEMQRIFFEVGTEFLNDIYISLLLKTARNYEYCHVDICEGNITEL